MDAYDLGNRVIEYWADLYPKHSGEMPKPNTKVKVLVNTTEGFREVVGVHTHDGHIVLELDKE
jgi:hypothetical protein